MIATVLLLSLWHKIALLLLSFCYASWVFDSNGYFQIHVYTFSAKRGTAGSGAGASTRGVWEGRPQLNFHSTIPTPFNCFYSIPSTITPSHSLNYPYIPLLFLFHASNYQTVRHIPSTIPATNTFFCLSSIPLPFPSVPNYPTSPLPFLPLLHHSSTIYFFWAWFSYDVDDWLMI